MADAQKLSVSEKLGYSLGDCAANFVFQTQLIFLLSFYTDVFGIAASTVAWMFFASRLFDAFNDPLMGGLADRTRTRWGKYRPWVLLTAVPFAVFFVLAYTTPDLSVTGKVIWACVTYNLMMLAYTANNIPYSSLTGVLTGDPDERTSLVSWRFILAMTAAFLVQTFTMDMVKYFGGEDDPALGYQTTMAIWATLAVVMFAVTFFTTKERVQPDPNQQTSVLSDLADLFASRTWVALAVAIVFVFVHLAMRGAATPYYFDYYVLQTDPVGPGELDLAFLGFSDTSVALQLSPIGWFNGAGLLMSMLGILLSKPLAVRFGKRYVFGGALLLTSVLTSLFFFPPGDNLSLIIGLQMLTQFVYGITIPLLWAMMADVADHIEWTTSRRATAMTFAASLFALKIGATFGSVLAAVILDAFGYVANQPQTPDALLGIRLIFSVLPAAAFLISVAALRYYSISRQTEIAMGDDLAERRRGYAAS